MASYTLVINNIPTEDSNDLVLRYNTNSKDSQKTFNVDNNKETWTCTLQNLSYSKAIYKPGELQFNLQITGCKNANNIYQTFKEKTVTLTSEGDDKTNNISKDYYIFGTRIQKKSDIFYITVQAFDPFKYLTLDKYCKAYTGKKFILDILWNTALWPNQLPTAIKKTQFKHETSIRNKTVLEQKKKTLEWIIADLKREKETESQKPENERDEKKIKELENKIQELQAEDKETDDNINKIKIEGNSIFNITPQLLHYHNGIEFIQPYLVQYNESFFDFLVRVSNRCGEFLYYEDGYFNIGWKNTEVKTPITNYVSINFAQNIATAWKENSLSSVHNDYTTNENKKNSGTATNMYDSNLASDENLASIPPKEEYTQWTDFALWPGCYHINIITDIINSANIAEALTQLLVSTTATSTASAKLANDTNQQYEETYFNKKEAYINERQNGKRIHPFSTSNSNTTTIKNSEAKNSEAKEDKSNNYIPFSLEFYEVVRKGIEKNEQSRIQIALGTYFYPLSLGSLIVLDNETYIVVQINGCVNNETETLDIEAIPYAEKETVFPPAAPVSSIREAKAQRAVITHNLDPLKMNRVRVRYPWQDESEDSTPWIRIALPMASDGCGFNFLPQINDEAIINYENGNIERPYVEGMLFTGKSSVPCDFKQNNARVISSANGHSIIFSDPSSANTNAISGLSPGWKTINGFVPGAIKWDLKEYNKKAMGGIELTDEHGLYSISMSSDKRAISIDSPLGKVDINAFTGITISAPNGNVRIEGKNIDIVAGNNLSISSGNNIASHFWHMKDSKWGEGGKDFAKKLVTSFVSKFEVIDMNLIRTILETFIRPCAGTLLIKSNRYLCFEAGKGEAQIAGRQTIKHLNPSKKETIKQTSKLFYESYFKNKETTIPYGSNTVTTNRIPMHINNFIQAIDTAIASFNAINNSLKEAKTCYEDAYTRLNNITRQNSNNVLNNFDDFNTLYTNITNNNFAEATFQAPNAQALKPQAINKIKLNIKLLNINAKKIKDKKLTQDNILDKFMQTLQDPVLKHIINNSNSLKDRIKNIFNEFASYNVNNRSFINANLSVDTSAKRQITYEVLNQLIQNQSSQKENTEKIAQLQQQRIFNAYRIWVAFCDSIAYDNPQTTNKSKLKYVGKELVGKPLIGYNDKLEGILDQYIWDSNEDTGKILFSDQEGETLNFRNKEIHYYKKSEINDPLKELKKILINIR